ncbi:MAG: hypothetical protein QM845_01845, partial [Verrucomicrobiota bacterium]|nr:hypothetical protein [Verrucomicrobiota bacterium]
MTHRSKRISAAPSNLTLIRMTALAAWALLVVHTTWAADADTPPSASPAAGLPGVQADGTADDTAALQR